jgi:hypothetical protein
LREAWPLKWHFGVLLSTASIHGAWEGVSAGEGRDRAVRRPLQTLRYELPFSGATKGLPFLFKKVFQALPKTHALSHAIASKCEALSSAPEPPRKQNKMKHDFKGFLFTQANPDGV